MVSSLITAAHAEPAFEVLPRSEVKYQPLNPLRGDASRRAGVLWGDITRDVASGSLIEFANGFASPPHIHNITYRGVVISGAVHNDDPDAEVMWMGPGSFWTQPAGEVHITSARPGGQATAFLEILEGPYLVQPSDEAFDNGERPVNIEARNVVWLSPSDVTWVDVSGSDESGDSESDVQMAFLWGSPADGGELGTFLKLAPGAAGQLRGNEAWLRAVVITGQIQHQWSGGSELQALEPGGYFGATDSKAHVISCASEGPCTLYVRTEGKYEFSGSTS